MFIEPYTPRALYTRSTQVPRFPGPHVLLVIVLGHFNIGHYVSRHYVLHTQALMFPETFVARSLYTPTQVLWCLYTTTLPKLSIPMITPYVLMLRYS